MNDRKYFRSDDPAARIRDARALGEGDSSADAVSLLLGQLHREDSARVARSICIAPTDVLGHPSFPPP